MKQERELRRGKRAVRATRNNGKDSPERAVTRKLQSNAVVTPHEAARFGKRPPLSDFQGSEAVQVAQRRCAIPVTEDVPPTNNDK